MVLKSINLFYKSHQQFHSLQMLVSKSRKKFPLLKND